MQVHAYLNFEGRCEEALEFYKQALGAQVLFMMRMKDAPPGEFPVPPEAANKIMHARFQVGNTTLMASDGMGEGAPVYKGITLSVNAADMPEAQKAFDGLSPGGSVQMPLQATFWSPGFAMLTDKFGVPWMINIDQGDKA